jgi:hypothetical protein
MGSIIEKNQRSTISCYCTFKAILKLASDVSVCWDWANSGSTPTLCSRLHQLEQPVPGLVVHSFSTPPQAAHCPAIHIFILYYTKLSIQCCIFVHHVSDVGTLVRTSKLLQYTRTYKSVTEVRSQKKGADMQVAGLLIGLSHFRNSQRLVIKFMHNGVYKYSKTFIITKLIRNKVDK